MLYAIAMGQIITHNQHNLAHSGSNLTKDVTSFMDDLYKFSDQGHRAYA